MMCIGDHAVIIDARATVPQSDRRRLPSGRTSSTPAASTSTPDSGRELRRPRWRPAGSRWRARYVLRASTAWATRTPMLSTIRQIIAAWN